MQGHREVHQARPARRGARGADQRVVLLIDEIDKADIEFPNDLLLELDAMRFRIDETGREVVARERPVVIITSNNEKELPDAFLRRCVFHYIQFPDRELMAEIVRVHHPDITNSVLDNALEVFFGLRATPTPPQEAVDLGADRLDHRAQEVRRRSRAGRPRHPVPRHAAQDRSGRRARAEAEGVIPAQRSRAVLDRLLFELRRGKCRCRRTEVDGADGGARARLARQSLDGFYRLCRTICVKDIALYDAYDEAFLAYFKDIHAPPLELTRSCADWLTNPQRARGAHRRAARGAARARPRQAARAVRAAAQGAEGASRRRQSLDRHRRSRRSARAASTRPGCGSARRRRPQRDGGRGSAAVSEYRRDIVLDVRQIDVALRGLRRLGREGAIEELDLDETVDETCKNGGEIDIVFRPPRAQSGQGRAADGRRRLDGSARRAGAAGYSPRPRAPAGSRSFAATTFTTASTTRSTRMRSCARACRSPICWRTARATRSS